ncbi:MAG: YdcF family protein [Clostridia bacterium]|nr:YdcF family protein [Clostridia bacterium]
MKLIKTTLIICGIILFVWFVIPFTLFGILNAGNMIGIAFSILLILYGIYFSNINHKILKFRKMKIGNVIFKLILLITLLIVIFIIFTTAKMIWRANNIPQEETTVVVLGCQVKPYGPSLMLQERLDAAHKYLSENKNIKCILSGGKGNDEPMSEAECMYNWLVDMGIDKDRLYMEDKSTSTRENLIFSKRIIEENGLNSVMTIITNDFHQYRASQIAETLGIKNYNVSGKTLITLLPTYYVRELGGILFEIFIPI